VYKKIITFIISNNYIKYIFSMLESIRDEWTTIGNKEFRRKPEQLLVIYDETADTWIEFRMHLSGRMTHLSASFRFQSRGHSRHSSYSQPPQWTASFDRLRGPYLHIGWAGWQFYYDIVALILFSVNHHFSLAFGGTSTCVFAIRFLFRQRVDDFKKWQNAIYSSDFRYCQLWFC